MLIPLAVLAAGAVAAGFVFEPYFAGHAYDEFWKGVAVHRRPQSSSARDARHSGLGFI